MDTIRVTMPDGTTRAGSAVVKRRVLCSDTGHVETLTFTQLVRQPYLHVIHAECGATWTTTTDPKEWGVPLRPRS